MKKFIYPGIFHKEDNAFWVEFPDLEGCQSFADSLEEVYENAGEALEGYLMSIIEKGGNPPAATNIYEIKIPDNAVVSLVHVALFEKLTA